MPNHSAFISELYYHSNTSITEFIEVTLKASEDPADYTFLSIPISGALCTRDPTLLVRLGDCCYLAIQIFRSRKTPRILITMFTPYWRIFRRGARAVANLARLPCPKMTLVRLSTPIASVDRTCCSQKVPQQT